MSDPKLLSVAEARARILDSIARKPKTEFVPLGQARNRVLGADLVALRTQPPLAVSAMDGYAVRAEDLQKLPVRLKQIGESAAGHGYEGSLQAFETVRIFTGAPVPFGADAILIQENAEIEDGFVRPTQSPARGRYIREAGLDFSANDILLEAGRRLRSSELALAAAMNHPMLCVTQRPKIAILATGDELVPPGGRPNPNQIIASNSFALAALIEAAGGEAHDLGIAGDDYAALEAGIAAARNIAADVLITLGGASVGDHDLVKSALAQEGMELGFWKIAMRPGRPLLHGRLGDMIILGLPGNPVSAIVCGHIFVLPLVSALCGDADAKLDRSEPALLAAPLRINDSRQDYLRATLSQNDDRLPFVTPFEAQDSSLLRVLAEAQCLLIREPHAPAAAAGDPCRIIRLNF
jgi:molybdopterin molybdotransferase